MKYFRRFPPGASPLLGQSLTAHCLHSQVVVTYRYGREEDEVMGLNFAKEITVFKEQIFPQANNGELSELQVGTEPLLTNTGGII